MSTSVSQASSVNPNTLITVKVLYNDNTRRFKIPLKELEARVLPQKVCPHPSSDRSLQSSPVWCRSFLPLRTSTFQSFYHRGSNLPGLKEKK